MSKDTTKSPATVDPKGKDITPQVFDRKDTTNPVETLIHLDVSNPGMTEAEVANLTAAAERQEGRSATAAMLGHVTLYRLGGKDGAPHQALIARDKDGTYASRVRLVSQAMSVAGITSGDDPRVAILNYAAKGVEGTSRGVLTKAVKDAEAGSDSGKFKRSLNAAVKATERKSNPIPPKAAAVKVAPKPEQTDTGGRGGGRGGGGASTSAEKVEKYLATNLPTDHLKNLTVPKRAALYKVLTDWAAEVKNSGKIA